MTNIADGAPSLSSYLDWIYPIFTQRNPANHLLRNKKLHGLKKVTSFCMLYHGYIILNIVYAWLYSVPSMILLVRLLLLDSKFETFLWEPNLNAIP